MVKHPYLKFGESTYAYGKVVSGLTNKALKIVQIPPVFDDDCVVELGSYSFSNASMTSVFIPKNILYISWAAFEGCSSLSEVRFEAGSRLEKIRGGAFSLCSQLKKIDFPSSVKEIQSSDWKAFREVSLECFSYLGTSTFPETIMFNSVSVIHVSSSYESDKLGKFPVTNDDQRCDVSQERFYPKRRLCNSPNIRYQCHTNNIILITIFLSR